MNEKDLYPKFERWIKQSDPNAVIWKVSDRFLKGIPDIICISEGRFYAFEIKLNHKLQPIQDFYLNKIVLAGGFAFFSSGTVIFSLKTQKKYDITKTTFEEVKHAEEAHTQGTGQ